MEFLNSPFLETALILIGLLLALVSLFLFGRGVLETIFAALRIGIESISGFFRMLLGPFVAIGWYLLGGVVLLGLGAAWLGYVYYIKPGELSLARHRPPICTELLDRKGEPLDYICPFDGIRIWRPISAMSSSIRALVVMLEDDKFYEHGGLDVDEIWNSLEKDLEKKKIARGGSTITQQLAKNLFLTKEKSILRKASEVPLALRLEREFTKDQILELYLNTIEWGPGIYGIEAASRLYFDHEAATLKEHEAWLLALMIPNPKELNLWIAPKAKKSLLKRAAHLSKRLYLEHRMTKDEAHEALAKFTEFVENWSRSKPERAHVGRRFPARWMHDRGFSLSQVVSIRRGAAGLLRRYKQSPLRSNLDRDIQLKLETKLGEAAELQHVQDLSDVIALVDGEKIRAMVPYGSGDRLAQVSAIGAEDGLQAKIFPARSIPQQALWP